MPPPSPFFLPWTQHTSWSCRRVKESVPQELHASPRWTEEPQGVIGCQGRRWIPRCVRGPTPLSIMQCQLLWGPALALVGWETLFQGSENSIYNQPPCPDFKMQHTSVLTGSSALMCGWRFHVWDFRVGWMKFPQGWWLTFVCTSGFRVGDSWLSEVREPSF